METSQEINALAEALAKAQAEIKGAIRDSENPYFKSKYADLASCWEAARGPLTRNGLSVAQGVGYQDGAEGVAVTTLLLHSSGQWLKSVICIVPGDMKPQTVGSAATYGRRYGFCAMVGIAPEDDDGNAAQGASEARASEIRPYMRRGPKVQAPQGGGMPQDGNDEPPFGYEEPKGAKVGAGGTAPTRPQLPAPASKSVETVKAPVLDEPVKTGDQAAAQLRETLIRQATKLFNAMKWKEEERAEAFKTYLGAKVMTKEVQAKVDPAAMDELVKFLKLRCEQKGLDVAAVLA